MFESLQLTEIADVRHRSDSPRRLRTERANPVNRQWSADMGRPPTPFPHEFKDARAQSGLATLAKEEK